MTLVKTKSLLTLAKTNQIYFDLNQFCTYLWYYILSLYLPHYLEYH